MTTRSGESPLLRVRLSRELVGAVTHAAEQAGISRSDWVRRALTGHLPGSDLAATSSDGHPRLRW